MTIHTTSPIGGDITTGDVLVALILAAWFLGTVAFQFVPGHRWLQQSFMLALFPVWHLFAPQPILGDYHLLYRTLRPDGEDSDWVEIPLIGDHTFLNSFFHPGRYTEKTITSIISALSGDLAVSPDVSDSWAFWRLDAFARHHAPADPDSEIQWAIVESFGYRPGKDSEVLFLSPVQQEVPA